MSSPSKVHRMVCRDGGLIEVHERCDGLRQHYAIKAEKVTGEMATVTFSLSVFEVAALQQQGKLVGHMDLVTALKLLATRAWALRNSTGDIPFGYGSFGYGGTSSTSFNFGSNPYDMDGI